MSMTGGAVGANIPQMQALEQRMQQESVAVQELMSRIDNALRSTVWEGAAAVRFREEWDTQFKKALTTLSQALDQNAVSVRNTWQAIQTATGG
jgi:uncharacterized protein YukE